MNKDLNQIDEFYKEALQSHTQNASAYTWTRMHWRLLWLNYSNYFLGLVAMAILGLGIYFSLGLFGDGPGMNNENTAFGIQIIDKKIAENQVDISAVNTESESTFDNEQISGSVSDQPKTINSISVLEKNTSTRETDKKELVLINNNVTNTFITEESAKNELLEISANEHNNESIFTLEPLNLSFSESPIEFTGSKKAVEIERRKHWVSVGFYVAPAYTTVNLQADQNLNEYNNYREKHENPAISVSAGLDVILNIKNWYIQTGLVYSEFKQNRNYNHSFKALDSLNSYLEVDTVFGWVFDPPNLGESIILGFDTTFFPVYDETNEGYNKWTYLEMPLIAGYKFHSGRFSFDIGTGFSCGFLLNVEGNIPHLTEKNRFTELTDIKPEMNKYLFNYILQAGVSYHLTPNWSIRLSPFYKQNLNSVFDSNYPVDQKFRSIGINFGFKVDL